MQVVERPKILGAGLVALDLVIGLDPNTPIKSWAGGTCGNILSILAFLKWDAYPIARMNGDQASQRVRLDMNKWGVKLDFTDCVPTSHTPIIIQEIRKNKSGETKHRFLWSCPHCGDWLPRFKPVTRTAIETVMPAIDGTKVFFMDRLSRATLTLAEAASKQGAIVFFEPSGKSDKKLFKEAIHLSHVLKYADQRMDGLEESMAAGTDNLIEIKTSGALGLQFRHRLNKTPSDWLHLPAIDIPYVADSCGAGDWCSAGFIAKALNLGQVGLKDIGANGVKDALKYGQALAAWNCGFEGARGGMYTVKSKGDFDAQIYAIISGTYDLDKSKELLDYSDLLVACPSCPSEQDNIIN